MLSPASPEGRVDGVTPAPTSRCFPCRLAAATYRARLRKRHATGIPPLGRRVDGAATRTLVKRLLIEGFTYAELARRLGLRRFRLSTTTVTHRKALQVRRLARLTLVDSVDSMNPEQP